MLKALASLVFLPRCAGCDAWLEEADDFVCPACLAGLHFLAAPAHLPHLSRRHLDEAHSVLAYEGLAHDWIHQYKYSRRFYLGPLLVRLLAESGLHWDSYDVLVPVPLHWRRRLGRGFNQSHLLAHGLGKKIGKPSAHFLARKRGMPPQAGLSVEERRQNVEDVFQIAGRKRSALQGASLLLVDDVLTTGATANACAKILKSAGAKRVDVLTLARPL